MAYGQGHTPQLDISGLPNIVLLPSQPQLSPHTEGPLWANHPAAMPSPSRGSHLHTQPSDLPLAWNSRHSPPPIKVPPEYQGPAPSSTSSLQSL